MMELFFTIPFRARGPYGDRSIAYAPTEEAEDSVKEEFYYALQTTLDSGHSGKALFHNPHGRFQCKNGKGKAVYM